MFSILAALLIRKVEKIKNLISVLELRRLLVDLRTKRPDICIRYRLLGEMWGMNALKVIHVTEKGAILNDETRGKIINLSDLTFIMQFEIDAPFQGFEPHFHYNVQPMPEFQR